MSSFIHRSSARVYSFAQALEAIFHEGGNFLPQQKYFTKQIYKATVAKIGPVAATALTFFAADLVLHQFASNAFDCVERHFLSSRPICELFSWSPIKSIYWMSFGAVVMFAKYKKQKQAHPTNVS